MSVAALVGVLMLIGIPCIFAVIGNRRRSMAATDLEGGEVTACDHQ
jgi:hypothetical protein